MKTSRRVARALATIAAVGFLGSAPRSQGYCYGVGCPCANDDPTAGCANSTGTGALLTSPGAGMLTVTGMPQQKAGILIMAAGPDATPPPFFMGKLCIQPPLIRVPPAFNSGPMGTFAWSGLPSGHYQVWYRDPIAPPSYPCSPTAQVANTSNAFHR